MLQALSWNLSHRNWTKSWTASKASAKNPAGSSFILTGPSLTTRCTLDVCPICSDPHRDVSTVCVVENIQDVMAVENTQQFTGLYHVLGGVISPMDGIGPSDLEIDSLVARVGEGGVKEVILALSSTMEGDTTGFYIFRKLAPFADVKISIIARGISVGDELEYTDEVTLGRSILNRTPFEGK